MTLIPLYAVTLRPTVTVQAIVPSGDRVEAGHEALRHARMLDMPPHALTGDWEILAVEPR